MTFYHTTVRTTLMTGFPGETEEDFAELSEFVEEMKFDRLGCFAYSIEENTPAASMKDQLDEETKRHRQNIIMEQQGRIMAERNRKFIGKRIDVLCEGYDTETSCWYGRTYAEHSGYQKAGANFGMSPAMFAPLNPEAYYNGLLDVTIIPYRFQQ